MVKPLNDYTAEYIRKNASKTVQETVLGLLNDIVNNKGKQYDSLRAGISNLLEDGSPQMIPYKTRVKMIPYIGLVQTLKDVYGFRQKHIDVIKTSLTVIHGQLTYLMTNARRTDSPGIRSTALMILNYLVNSDDLNTITNESSMSKRRENHVILWLQDIYDKLTTVVFISPYLRLIGKLVKKVDKSVLNDYVEFYERPLDELNSETSGIWLKEKTYKKERVEKLSVAQPTWFFPTLLAGSIFENKAIDKVDTTTILLKDPATVANLELVGKSADTVVDPNRGSYQKVYEDGGKNSIWLGYNQRDLLYSDATDAAKDFAVKNNPLKDKRKAGYTNIFDLSASSEDVERFIQLNKRFRTRCKEVAESKKLKPNELLTPKEYRGILVFDVYEDMLEVYRRFKGKKDVTVLKSGFEEIVKDSNTSLYSKLSSIAQFLWDEVDTCSSKKKDFPAVYIKFTLSVGDFVKLFFVDADSTEGSVDDPNSDEKRLVTAREISKQIVGKQGYGRKALSFRTGMLSLIEALNDHYGNSARSTETTESNIVKFLNYVIETFYNETVNDIEEYEKQIQKQIGTRKQAELPVASKTRTVCRNLSKVLVNVNRMQVLKDNLIAFTKDVSKDIEGDTHDVLDKLLMGIKNYSGGNTKIHIRMSDFKPIIAQDVKKWISLGLDEGSIWEVPPTNVNDLKHLFKNYETDEDINVWYAGVFSKEHQKKFKTPFIFGKGKYLSDTGKDKILLDRATTENKKTNKAPFILEPSTQKTIRDVKRMLKRGEEIMDVSLSLAEEMQKAVDEDREYVWFSEEIDWITEVIEEEDKEELDEYVQREVFVDQTVNSLFNYEKAKEYLKDLSTIETENQDTDSDVSMRAIRQQVEYVSIYVTRRYANLSDNDLFQVYVSWMQDVTLLRYSFEYMKEMFSHYDSRDTKGKLLQNLATRVQSRNTMSSKLNNALDTISDYGVKPNQDDVEEMYLKFVDFFKNFLEGEAESNDEITELWFFVDHLRVAEYNSEAAFEEYYDDAFMRFYLNEDEKTGIIYDSWWKAKQETIVKENSNRSKRSEVLSDDINKELTDDAKKPPKKSTKSKKSNKEPVPISTEAEKEPEPEETPPPSKTKTKNLSRSNSEKSKKKPKQRKEPEPEKEKEKTVRKQKSKSKPAKKKRESKKVEKKKKAASEIIIFN